MRRPSTGRSDCIATATSSSCSPTPIVANDWLDRLAAHAVTRDVGVIGTFTNNVGTATYPLPRHANPLPPGYTVASLDALFARANAGEAVTLPAIDGPCLYFRRDCLSTVGSFDAGPLGSDYGVETDFCLRAGSAGFHHLLAGDVFVGHEGHASFAAREAIAWSARAEQALAKLYPTYRAQIDELAEREPGRPFARRVDLLRLAESGKRLLVFVSHPWGGGIRRYMNDLVALTDGRCEVLFLEPAVGDTVKLSWPRAGESFALYFSLPGELSMLAETMRTIGIERLHFHHIHLQPRSRFSSCPRWSACRTTTRCTTTIRSVRNTIWSPRTAAIAASRTRGLRSMPRASTGTVGTRHRHLARHVRPHAARRRAGHRAVAGRRGAHAPLFPRPDGRRVASP